MTTEKILAKYIPMTETMFFILLSLQAERHGYAIRQHVLGITQNRLEIGAGTMYQSLGKLHGDGLIRMTQEIDRQKKYIITDAGRLVLSTEARRIRELYQNVEGIE